MTWPNRVNINDHRTAYIDLPRCDGIPAELWIPAGHYGTSKRIKYRPETLTVEWQDGIRDSGWRLWSVWTTGIRIHKTANWTVSMRYMDHAKPALEFEPWMEPLIEETRPQ